MHPMPVNREVLDMSNHRSGTHNQAMRETAELQAEKWSKENHAPEYREKDHPRHFIVRRDKEAYADGFEAALKLRPRR